MIKNAIFFRDSGYSNCILDAERLVIGPLDSLIDYATNIKKNGYTFSFADETHAADGMYPMHKDVQEAIKTKLDLA